MKSGFQYGRQEPTGRDSCKPVFGIQTFIDDTGAYTTIAAAVSILLVVVLLFASVSTIWSLSHAEDIQSQADICALAGTNVISAYVECASVMDACVLSMSLTGLCLTAVGLIGLFIPAVNVAAQRICETGLQFLEMRNEFAISAARGLQTMEESLPYIAAMHSMKTLEEGDYNQEYVGVAITYPLTSDSNLQIDSCELDLENLESQTNEMEEIAEQLTELQEEIAQAKYQAWLADCGREGHNMQERAGKLTSLTAALNPDYETSIAWNPVVGLDRTRAYYAWRYEHEQPLNNSLEERIKSAARKEFYEFSIEEFNQATVIDTNDKCCIDIKLLPKNTKEMKKSRIYRAAIWPTTMQNTGRVLHFSSECPGATGPSGGIASFANQDELGFTLCPVCHFSVKDIGAVPAASTAIDNGYEYHLAEYIRALQKYDQLRQDELELLNHAQGNTSDLADSFDEIVDTLSTHRPKIAPPGRYGCISYIAGAEQNLPSSLVNSFSSDGKLGPRGAVAAAVLAPDELTSENNILSSFTNRIQDEHSSVIDFIGDIFDVWGTLLVGYANIDAQMQEVFEHLVGGLNYIGGSAIADALIDSLGASLKVMGLQPADLHLRKPVLTNTSHVLQASGMEECADIQQIIRSLPMGVHDPVTLAQAVGADIAFYYGDETITLAEIAVPGTSIHIPIDVKVSDVLAAG